MQFNVLNRKSHDNIYSRAESDNTLQGIYIFLRIIPDT